jgi:hypothetical protein
VNEPRAPSKSTRPPAAEAAVTEENLKIRAEELATIRLVFGNGIIHEMPLAEAKGYGDAADSGNPEVSRHLNMLARALTFFSTKGVEPSIEFVVPISRR